MGNVQVDFNEGYLNVNINGKCIGSIEYSTNPYHNRHYYLKLQLKNYDIGIAKELFDLISLKLDKPMQIMLSSIEKEVVSFIQTAGFCCKRKCYEIEASTEEYIGEKIAESLSCAMVGDIVYGECSEIMFDRYISTHKRINPWTGRFSPAAAEPLPPPPDISAPASPAHDSSPTPLSPESLLPTHPPRYSPAPLSLLVLSRSCFLRFRNP